MEGFGAPAVGHNPIAFGCPLDGGAPLVFDIACSVAARGHILLAAREENPIPAGWALDAAGRPTVDAAQALRGSLLPMGGHKGIGIAMMVECLAGALAATAASLESGNNALPTAGAVGRQGGFLWMVKPGAYVPDALFRAYMTQWTNHYVEAGSGNARLPGQRAARSEQEGRSHGVPLSEAIVRELADVGERQSVPFPAADVAGSVDAGRE
jgi:LDH2 family malate/lactate/ureidoglycolate dehydrogenase